MRTLGYMGAFLSGAIAGAALGLLYAPGKGSETQKKIAETVDNFCKKHNIKIAKKDVEEFVEDIQEAASEE